MDFCWVDQYDAMAGVNRKSRRVMEEENKKLRKKARREYNETVRGLAEFVKKRDKRVVDMMVKRNKEMEKKKEEERERKKKLETEKAERAKKYEEPEWAKVNEEEYEVGIDEWEEEDEKKKKGEANEFYCVVCGKKFKSEKQWKNHEQSKKHKEKVAELRESFANEDEYMETMEEREGDNVDDSNLDGEHGEVDELEEQFQESVSVADKEEDDENVDEVEFSSCEEEDGHVSLKEADELDEAGALNEDEDEEMSILKAMVSGHKKKKKAGGRQQPRNSVKQTHVEDSDDGVDQMDYNKRKGTKNRRAKKERSKNKPGESSAKDENGFGAQVEDTSSPDNINAESNSQPLEAEETISKDADEVHPSHRNSGQVGEENGDSRKQQNAKSKKSAKGKKAKASSKNSDNLCEKCGQEFESRNKLHKHLNETGHASLKYR